MAKIEQGTCGECKYFAPVFREDPEMGQCDRPDLAIFVTEALITPAEALKRGELCGILENMINKDRTCFEPRS